MKATVIVIVLLVVVALLGSALWLWTPDKSRASLEAKYLNAPGDMMTLAGVRLHVRDSGPKDAPTLIMLHGFGSSLHTWEPWAQVLQNEYRVIRFDLPGAGLSQPDPGGRYADSRTVEVLTALMDQLGVVKVTLIGNSIGGRIAWTFAARNPDRVTKLVLISPDGFASKGFAYGRAPDVPTVIHLMRFVLPKALLRMNLKPAYGDPAALSEETVSRYHDLMLAPGVRDALIARLGQTVLQEPEPLLRLIRAPVLLLWGERDALIPSGNAADYERELPDSRRVVLPGLGHVPHEEAPAVSLVPVRAFLAR